MTTPIVTMEVRHPVEAVAVIDIAGEVTSACEPSLTAAYERASAPGVSRIVLNFTGLEYMNSGGIGMLVTLLVRANRQHQQVRAYGLSDHYRQILSLTRLDEAIAVCDDEASAIGAETATERAR
ncbi:MAG TPA: STAS domain-containing protein [Acidimicrobiales bacterium]|jgi:anti-sigma B factor antagonist|nr:STAS domain-containing protein [Acidimicrobiales bacterium]